ncbi:LapA family protein [Pseudoxanthomonas composti]|uniref:LapA family protein n=1 Tax=Pseudoxanthomonas composti TaxID=2137479 RepID=A0A4Q1JYB6_9GAMM|nr:LapA family protein [Pseudoxanthomonas composti]RXR07468.1 LapA family protein [Pseudoxanthomonas composti]
MNVLRLIVAILLIAVGLVAGVQNTDQVTLKFLTASVQTSSGVAIMLSVLIGAIAGVLIVLATMVWPLYSKLRRLNREAARAVPVSEPPTTPPAGL